MKKTAAAILILTVLLSSLGVTAGAAPDAERIRSVVGEEFMEHVRTEDDLTTHSYDAGRAVEGWLFGRPVYAEYSVTADGKVNLFILLFEAYPASRQEEAKRQFAGARDSVLGRMTPIGELSVFLAGEDQAAFEWTFPGDRSGEEWLRQTVDWFFSTEGRMVDNLCGSRSVFRFDRADATIGGTPRTQGTQPALGSAPREASGTDPEPAATEKGEWRWVEVETDCPACMGGTCPVCHGMGYTSMYGVRVDCDPKCPSCGGKGTFVQRQYHFFPEGSDTWLY